MLITANTPLISVIVPVFRVEHYLHRCLDSICNQTYRNLEIILVNDGSPDRCPEICDEYAVRDNRIKVLHKRNGGQSSARNAGIAVAEGEYIGFVDSDDYIAEDFYETLFHNLILHKAEVSVCGHQIIKNDLPYVDARTVPEGITIIEGDEILSELADDIWLRNFVWDKLYKIELIKGIIFPEGRLFEDIAVMYKILESVTRIVFTDEKKYFYIHHKDSTTSLLTMKGFYDCFFYLNEQMNFFMEKGLNSNADKARLAITDRAMFIINAGTINYKHSQNREIVKKVRIWLDLNKPFILHAHSAPEKLKKNIDSYFLNQEWFIIKLYFKEQYKRFKEYVKSILPSRLVVLIIKIKFMIWPKEIR